MSLQAAVADGRLTNEQMIRLARAKEHELETKLTVLSEFGEVDEFVADIALLYSLVAQHLEDCNGHHSPG